MGPGRTGFQNVVMEHWFSSHSQLLFRVLKGSSTLSVSIAYLLSIRYKKCTVHVTQENKNSNNCCWLSTPQCGFTAHISKVNIKLVYSLI